MGAMCCSSKDKPDNENDLNESTNTISCASDNEESNEILEQYKNELMVASQGLSDLKRGARNNSRLSIFQRELLDTHNFDSNENFSLSLSLRNMKGVFIGRDFIVKVYAVNCLTGVEQCLGNSETINLKEGVNNIVIDKHFNFEYNYFDVQQIKLEFHFGEDVFNYLVNMYELSHNNLKPMIYPIDFDKKEITVCHYDSHYNTYTEHAFKLVIERKTRKLDFNIYSFFVEFVLENSTNLVRKLTYQLFKKDGDSLSTRLFSSKEILSKKRFTFNMAMIKRNELYGDVTDNTMIIFDIAEEGTIIGDAKLSINAIKNFKLNEINNIDIKNAEGGSIGKLKLIYKELSSNRFLDIMNKGFNFKCAVITDSTSLVRDSELFGAQVKIFESLKSVLPIYMIDNYNIYGIGSRIEDSTENFKCIAPNNQDVLNFHFVYDELNKHLTKPKNKVVDISSTIREIINKENSQLRPNDYLLLFILLNKPVEDENTLKDVLVSVSKMPLSIFVVGLKQKDNNQKFGFLNYLKYNDDVRSQITNSKGEIRERSNVNFVKYNVDVDKSFGDLLQPELDCLTTQIEEYFHVISKSN